MNIGVSFTSLLRSVHEGALADLDELDEVRTGCQRVHVIRQDNLVPMEVSWLNRKMPHKYDEGISLEKCEAAALETWGRVSQWFIKMDAAGKVVWDVGNYPDLVDKLVGQGHRCFYSGEWHTTPVHPMRR